MGDHVKAEARRNNVVLCLEGQILPPASGHGDGNLCKIGDLAGLVSGAAKACIPIK
jgi:hypothetical protein